VSKGVATPSTPSEQVTIPSVGSVSSGQVTVTESTHL